MKKERRNNKGFSLVELIVVIAIMAVLMGVLAPQFLKYVEKSRTQKDESAVGEVVNATKIAVADEKIFNDLKITGSDTVTVTVPDDAAITVTATNVSAVTTSLKDELANVIGTVDFVSSTHNSQSFTVVISYNDTNKNYVFTSKTGWGFE